MRTEAKRKRTDPATGTESMYSIGLYGDQSSHEEFDSIALYGGQRIVKHEEFKDMQTRWSSVSFETLAALPREDFLNYRHYKEAERVLKMKEEATKKFEVTADKKRLVVKQLKEAQRRQLIEAKEMKKYFRKHPFDEKSFIKDIQTYRSLFVFCYGFANLESSTYKDFMQSLMDDHHNYKVYFAPNKALAYSVGLETELTPEARRLQPGDNGYTTIEFDYGLHEIGIMLDGDDCSGVLLTNKTDEEVLSKFREYREFDFVNAGSTPMETLSFKKGEVMPLSPLANAKKLCPKLEKLGMPVELSGQDIKLTEEFVVCEIEKHVTEEAAKIMILLGIRLFDFVLLPLGCWSRITKEIKRFHLPLPSRS